MSQITKKTAPTISVIFLLIILLCLILRVKGQTSRDRHLLVRNKRYAQETIEFLKQFSLQASNKALDLIKLIPITKILLVGGAVLSILFMFIRLVIVLGPIIILGALTRESNSANDFFSLLLEFYNRLLSAVDDQSAVITES